MYVSVDLADERYCDGCPLLLVIPTVVIPDKDATCRACERITLVRVRDDRDMRRHWLRPQTCIDASTRIAAQVKFALHVSGCQFLAGGDRQDWGAEDEAVQKNTDIPVWDGGSGGLPRPEKVGT